jgi:hypothetical protein
MPEHAARGALAASVLLSAGLIALTLALFDPFFTNDGAVMAMIASGSGLALQPDEHLVFTNVLLGRVVAALYRRASDVPWYGLHLVGAQALAWTGLFHACLARGVTGRRVSLCVLTYGVVGLGMLVNLQFSSTAFLVATAGGCLWMDAAARDGGRGWGAAAGAVLLMVLGSLERFDPFLLVLALAGLAGILAAGGWPGRRWLMVGAGAAVLALAAQAYDRHVYRQDPGWRSFREFIPLLPEITDYGHAAAAGPELAHALAGAGWSENDHRLFMQWFHADPEVYSADALRRLLAEAPETGPLQRIANGASRLGRVSANPALWAMLLALPCLLGPGAGRRRAAIVAGLLLAAFAATLLLAAFRKSAPQVYLPLFAFPLCVALASDGPRVPGRATRWRQALPAALAAAGVALSIAHQHREGRQEREQARLLWSRYASVVQSPQQLVVAWFNAFPFEVVRPLEPTTRLRSLRLFSLGWSQRTPLARDLLASFGSSDLIEALTDPRTLFLGPPAAPPLLALFAEEHRALRLRFTPEQEEPFATFRARVSAKAAER